MRELGSNPADVLFIQFAKSPLPGQVKTRMQPVLSAAQACALHCELLLWTCQTLNDAGGAEVELWLSGDMGHPIVGQCRAMGLADVRAQRGGDLGERMYDAISDGLRRYQKVILVGSDCPAIDAHYLDQSVRALDHKPLVIGPANDGGYVLVGATAISAEMFAGVSWGSNGVYAQTTQRIGNLGEQYAQLSSLSDIDRPEDLPLWEARIRR